MTTTPDLADLCKYESNLSELFEVIESKSINNWNIPLYTAAYAGNIKAWLLIIREQSRDRNPKDLSPSLYGACMGRHQKMFKIILNYLVTEPAYFYFCGDSAFNPDDIAGLVIKTGQPELYPFVEHWWDEWPVDVEILKGCAYTNNLDILRHVLSKSSYDREKSISSAVGVAHVRKNTDIFNVLLEYAVSHEIDIDWKRVAISIAENSGTMEQFEIAISNGADLRKCFKHVCESCDLTTIQRIYARIKMQERNRKIYIENPDETKTPPEGALLHRKPKDKDWVSDGIRSACKNQRPDVLRFLYSVAPPDLAIDIGVINMIAWNGDGVECLKTILDVDKEFRITFESIPRRLSSFFDDCANKGRVKLVAFISMIYRNSRDENVNETFNGMMSTAISGIIDRCQTDYISNEKRLITSGVYEDLVGTLGFLLRIGGVISTVAPEQEVDEADDGENKENIIPPSYFIITSLLDRGIDPELIKHGLHLNDFNHPGSGRSWASTVDELVANREAKNGEIARMVLGLSEEQAASVRRTAQANPQRFQEFSHGYTRNILDYATMYHNERLEPVTRIERKIGHVHSPPTNPEDYKPRPPSPSDF
jgi:hypothetical protein